MFNLKAGQEKIPRRRVYKQRSLLRKRIATNHTKISLSACTMITDDTNHEADHEVDYNCAMIFVQEEEKIGRGNVGKKIKGEILRSQKIL